MQRPHLLLSLITVMSLLASTDAKAMGVGNGHSADAWRWMQILLEEQGAAVQTEPAYEQADRTLAFYTAIEMLAQDDATSPAATRQQLLLAVLERVWKEEDCFDFAPTSQLAQQLSRDASPELQPQWPAPQATAAIAEGWKLIQMATAAPLLPTPCVPQLAQTPVASAHCIRGPNA